MRGFCGSPPNVGRMGFSALAKRVPEVFLSPSTRNRKESHGKSKTNDETEGATPDQHSPERTRDGNQQAKEYDDER